MPVFTPISFVRISVERPPAVAARLWNQWIAEGHNLIGRLWHERYLPQHFQAGTQRQYKIARRSARYLKRKARMAARGKVEDGGDTLLVFSGSTRRAVTEFVRVSSTGKRATVSMDAPWYVSFTRKSGIQPDLPGEITEVTLQEQESLAADLGAFMGTKLNGFRQPTEL